MWATVQTLEDIFFANVSEKNTTEALDWTKVYDVVRCVQLTMALLSILGSGSIIACVISQRQVYRPELQPLLLLCVSDLLLALCWLLGALLFSEHCSSVNTLCYNLHTVEQVLYMASFFYTLNFTWNLYIGIREKLKRCFHGYSVQFSNRVNTAGKTTAVLSGVVPLLLMMPVFIEGNINQCQANFSQPYRCLLMDTGVLYLTSKYRQPVRSCRLLHTYAVSVFLISFVLTLLSNTALVVRARHLYRRVLTSAGYLGNEQQTSLRVMDRRMLLYPMVFIICWGPAAALAFLHVVMPSACQGEVGVVLYISQTFTTASQGSLNCLVYGFTHARLGRGGLAVLSRDVDTQTPLLQSQKTGRSYQALS